MTALIIAMIGRTICHPPFSIAPMIKRAKRNKYGTKKLKITFFHDSINLPTRAEQITIGIA